MIISRIMSISKILTNICAIRQKIRIKNTFSSIVCSVLVVKQSWRSAEKVCLKIAGKQSVKLRDGTIKFKNYSYASYTKKYQKHIRCSFAYKVVCIGNKFSQPVVLYTVKNAVN